MFLARLPILTYAYSIFLLLPPISTFAGDFYTHSPVDFTFNHDNIDVPVPASPTRESRKTVLGFGRGNAIATGAIILITLLNVAVYMLRLLYEENSGEKLYTTEQLCRRFSLGEILSATGNFDDSLVIGKGGFGKVYKGVTDINGPTTVAIKRLNPMSKQGAPEFWTEIEMLSKFRHSHLVSLIGYCDSYNEMALVYEYMIRGTLADHLHKIDKNDNNSSLSWVQRLRICIGAARGLDYLHTGTGIQHRVIHRDVKSTNILLDENWAAKISDFGLSKFGPADQTCTHVSTNNIKGTFGYLDPEYFLTRRFSTKTDVYAFGVVLFEVLCERPAVDLSLDGEQRGLAGWAQQCLKEGTIEQIIGPSLKWQILPDSLTAFVQIAGQCLHNRLKKRPTMAEIVVKLEFALALQVSTDSSVIEGYIINNMDSYAEDKQIDEIIRVGDSIGKQSLKKPKMTFTRKVLLFFSVIALDVHTDAKSSRNAKSNNNSGYNSKLPNKDGGFVLEVPSSGQIVIPNLKMFTFAELISATRNFRLELLGEGGFGMVFKGYVDEKTYAPSKAGVGKAIAVKILKPDSFHGPKEWLTEVEYFGKFSHPNLVELLGHCSEDEKFLIVYEYMPKGSLDFHLFKSVGLPWVTRLKIAIGAARGLAFLHTTYGQVIRRSVTTSDILLDGDFNAKLSNFGLAKIGPPNGKSHISTRVMGTYGFAAPEYVATGCLYVKSDVYSFGVVLLEILTGQKVLDKNRPSGKHNLVVWAKPLLRRKRKLKRVMDPQLEHDCPPEGAFQFAALILKCLENYPKYRPSMEEVLETLEQISTI